MAKFKEAPCASRRMIAQRLGVKFDPSTLEVTFQDHRVGKFLKDENGLVIEENGPLSREVLEKTKQLADLLQPA